MEIEYELHPVVSDMKMIPFRRYLQRGHPLGQEGSKTLSLCKCKLFGCYRVSLIGPSGGFTKEEFEIDMEVASRIHWNIGDGYPQCSFFSCRQFGQIHFSAFDHTAVGEELKTKTESIQIRKGVLTPVFPPIDESTWAVKLVGI